MLGQNRIKWIKIPEELVKLGKLVPHRNLGLVPVLEVLGIHDLGYRTIISKFMELSPIVSSDTLNSNKKIIFSHTFSDEINISIKILYYNKTHDVQQIVAFVNGR